MGIITPNDLWKHTVRLASFSGFTTAGQIYGIKVTGNILIRFLLRITAEAIVETKNIT